MHSVELNKLTSEEVKSLNGVPRQMCQVIIMEKRSIWDWSDSILDFMTTKNDQELQTFPSVALTLCHFHLD